MTTSIQRHHSNPRMSKIVRHGGIVYLCGQTASGSGAEGVAAQTLEVLSRIDTLLAEAGTDRSRLLSVLIHLKSIDDFQAMNEVWEGWISTDAAPARTTVEARLASASLLVEMTVVAAAD